jgi:high-affinity iron transporter
LIAGGVAWAWTHYAHRVNLARFFQVTAVFLLVFVIELFISAFHELFEANVLPGIDNARWHAVTEPYSSDGVYGQWLTYAMVALPLAWLAFTNFTDRRLRLSRRSTA